MILDPTRTSPLDSAVISHIVSGIADVCDATMADSSDVVELARAVEHFVKEGDRAATDSDHLTVLASKALTSIGNVCAARRLILFGTGMVRPSEWIITGFETAWVLDLKHITVRIDSSLELVFFTNLDTIVESIADIWDDSEGRGVLGLRHVCAAASSLLGSGEDKKKVAGLAAEIKALCSSRLEQVREVRGWKSAPVVMNLDM